MPADRARLIRLVGGGFVCERDLAVEVDTRDIGREGAAAVNDLGLDPAGGRQAGAHVRYDRKRSRFRRKNLEPGDRINHHRHVDRQLLDRESVSLQPLLDISDQPPIGVGAVRARANAGDHRKVRADLGGLRLTGDVGFRSHDATPLPRC